MVSGVLQSFRPGPPAIKGKAMVNIPNISSKEREKQTPDSNECLSLLQYGRISAEPLLGRCGISGRPSLRCITTQISQLTSVTADGIPDCFNILGWEQFHVLFMCDLHKLKVNRQDLSKSLQFVFICLLCAGDTATSKTGRVPGLKRLTL